LDFPKGANMRQHGRKSAASLAAAAAIESDEQLAAAKLEPPAYLREREREEWRAIVARFGSEAFPHETRTLLAAFCGMIVSLSEVNAELAKFPGIPRDRSGWCKFRDLIALRGALATQVASVGTKLRILPQSHDVRRLRTSQYDRLAEDDIKPWNDVN
jgi:hypothetical protein